MKKLLYLVTVGALLAIAMLLTKRHWIAHYNEYFGGHVYHSVSKDKQFIVSVEPENFTPPAFLKTLLAEAFNEYEVIFDNYIKPDMVVRCENISRKEAVVRSNLVVPYLTISGEPHSIKVRKYKKYGLPFAELVSTTPANPRELYFPFVGWSGVELADQRSNDFLTAEKEVLYVSSNCTAIREKMFALLKNKLPHVDALGSCSNPDQAKIPGGYTKLVQAYANYKFGFAMENSKNPGYITEKIANVFNSGAIPIYWGDSQTVNRFFNKDAFVNIANFKNLEQAANYIADLSKDPARIKAMHEVSIYANNAKDDILHPNSENNTYVVEQAKKVRNLYDQYLVKHKKSK
jgi:hypothetical protein